MKVELRNLKNEIVGETDLPDRIFVAKWNPRLVQQVLEAQLDNRRRPWAHAKGRGEVSGGGRKPWRQKGTGRARHGSSRSPIWRKGGKAHGPSKERDYSQKINKKMKRLALFSVLSRKFKDKEIKIFDELKISEPKTKTVSAILKPLLGLSQRSKKFDLLMITDAVNRNLFRAARNLTKTLVLDPRSLNVFDLMNHKNIFIDKESITTIANHYRME